MKFNILVAGVAGASLGTEIVKSLQSNIELYNVYVCDISNMAFGLYDPGIKGSFISDRNNYYESILEICKNNDIHAIIPGGEQPMRILTDYEKSLKDNNVVFVSNEKSVVNLCSDKAKLFDFLKQNKVRIPETCTEGNMTLEFPCVVKPAIDSGGSFNVFLAGDQVEADNYSFHIKKSGNIPVFQEYLPLEEGEYSFTVLSDTRGHVLGGVGIKKRFDSKLFYVHKSEKGIISSGYSQGKVGKFEEIFKQVEIIAILVGSKGPLNIEGRVKNGIFIPFEINPRFSASTYLWSLTGFNEVDIFLKHLLGLPLDKDIEISEGYAIRSFTEKFLTEESIKR